MKSLMQMLIEAGYPQEDMDHYGSDLYIYVTPLTTRVLHDWCVANEWDTQLLKNYRFMISTFKCNITGRKMYDIAFQYLPWWNEKCNVREEVSL